MSSISYKTSKRVKKRSAAKRLWPLGILLLFFCVIAALELTNTIHLFKSVPASKVIVKVGAPTPKPANNTSAGSAPAKTNTTNNTHVITGGTDTNGSAVAGTNPSQWVVSQSGNITVKQPTANATIQSGGIISGSAKVSFINYRLIDNAVGVISEGTLNVISGNFSGTLKFTPVSTSGRLDVFNTNAQGVELNEVQIAVSF